MRIISGNFKGKKIILPKDNLTRPLKDLTKESIFNIIKHSKLLNIELKNSNILDLFSGVGSFGLESDHAFLRFRITQSEGSERAHFPLSSRLYKNV